MTALVFDGYGWRTTEVPEPARFVEAVWLASWPVSYAATCERTAYVTRAGVPVFAPPGVAPADAPEPLYSRDMLAVEVEAVDAGAACTRAEALFRAHVGPAAVIEDVKAFFSFLLSTERKSSWTVYGLVLCPVEERGDGQRVSG